jgi:serine/threonine protein phosphatase 1
MVTLYLGDDLNSRYILGELDENDEKQPLIFICINPSKASATVTDPAMDKIKKISKKEGYNSYIMLNVYPQRATDPNNLPDTTDTPDTAMHEKNIEVITSIVKNYSTVVAAWGVHIEKRKYLIGCLKDILKALKDVTIYWKYLDDPAQKTPFTKNGNPRHPGRLSDDTRLNNINEFCINNHLRADLRHLLKG